MNVMMYGLKNCDTCAKARKWLDKAGIAYTFVDYREQPIPGEALKAWGASLGFDKMINRASTTWKNLPENRKKPDSAPEYVLLLREYPALLKRPFVMVEGRYVLGFTHGQYEKEFLGG